MGRRRDEIMLCLENEGTLYRSVGAKLRNMTDYGTAATRIRIRVSDAIRSLKLRGHVTAWTQGDTERISTHEITDAYLSSMEWPDITERELCCLKQKLREQYEIYMRRAGKEPRLYADYRNDETQPQVETATMKKTLGVIDTFTTIDEVPARDLSDDAIFGIIGQLEQEIASLNKIEHKPAKLLARTDELRKRIAALVEYVDGRP